MGVNKIMNKNFIYIAKNLRKSSTEAEKHLWRYLRQKQLEGFKFRRQEPIGKYIVGFVNFEKKIIIEIDGGQHASEKEKDGQRDKWLNGQGFKVLRFWNNEVFENIEGILEVIRRKLLSFSPNPSHPAFTREKGISNTRRNALPASEVKK